MKKVLLAALFGTVLYSLPVFAGEFVYSGEGISYTNEDGSWKIGWFQDENGSWYYFGEDGYAKTEWYEDNGNYYYFRVGSGKMIADRTITLEGKIYWFDENGVCTRLPKDYSGWMKDDISRYYRLADGSYLDNGWNNIDNDWYYFNEQGYVQTGMLELDGVLYYLKENGVMAQDETLKVDEKTYEFDSTGAGTEIWPYKPITVIPPDDQKSDLHKTLDGMCDQILAGITNDGMTKRQKAEAIYRWIRSNFRYAGSSASRDWVQEAYVGLIRRRGDCYTYYSVSQALLTRCGIQSIEVIRCTDNHHYWNLINCGDGWYHFDATPRASPGYFCMWTDAQMLQYSAIYDNCFFFDPLLYPRTPE